MLKRQLALSRCIRKRIKASQSAYERSLWDLVRRHGFAFLKVEPRKAIPLLKECKSFFTQDGTRSGDSLWSVIWLAVAYEQGTSTKRLPAMEIGDILSDALANPTMPLLVTIRQAGPWLKDLQNDPQIGRQFGQLHREESASCLPNCLPFADRCAVMLNLFKCPPASLNIRAFGRAEVNVNGSR